MGFREEYFLEFFNLKSNWFECFFNNEIWALCVYSQKQPFADVHQKKCALNFRNIHRKTPVLESRVCNFIKKRLQHRCFPVINAKFLRKVLFIEHFWWLLIHTSFERWYIRTLFLSITWTCDITMISWHLYVFKLCLCDHIAKKRLTNKIMNWLNFLLYQ